MKPFINYLIESGISLGIFTLVYWLFLRGETQFKASRFFLLFALLFSTLLPFLTIRMDFFNSVSALSDQQLIGSEIETNLLGSVTVFASGIPAKLGNALLTFDYSIVVYQLGALAALFVIASGIFQLLLMVSKNRVYKMKKTRLVFTSKEQSPYSFFNYIFIGKSLTDQKNWKTIVYHELEHVKQGHSFDVLFVDCMMIFQWFNPFYWIIRKMVRENHEFMADHEVISRGMISGGRYKELLLSQSIGGYPVITSNFFNVKTIKKRFKMIAKNKNKKYGFLKYTMGVIVALSLTLLFACEEFDKSIVQKNSIEYIYNGEFKDFSEIQALGIKQLQINEIEKLDVILLYPELADQLKRESYYLVFDSNDLEQMKLYSKLEVKNLSATSHTTDELVVVAYGNDKASEIEEEVFVIVDNMPEFPGGELELRKTIGQQVKYPVSSKEKGIQGKVYVTFTVGIDGWVKDAKIARGVDSSLDNEALRVISSLPKWIPGTQRGKAVAVRYTVPINFVLQ